MTVTASTSASAPGAPKAGGTPAASGGRRASPPGALSRRFALAVGWLFANTAVGQLASLATSVVVARLLGKAEFGGYGLVLSTAATLGVLAGLGLGVTATKHVAQYRHSDPERAGGTIVLCELVALAGGLLVTVVAAVLAGMMAAHWLREPALTGPLRVASALVLCNALAGAQSGVLVGLEEYRFNTLLNAVRGIATLVLSVAGVLVAGLSGAVWALVLGAALTVGVGQVGVVRAARRAGVPLSLRTAALEHRVLVDFALPAFLAGLLNTPTIWFGSVLLARQPAGLAEVAVLNVALQWRNMLFFLPAVLTQAALPVMAGGRPDADDEQRLARVWRLTHGATVVSVLPTAVLLMFGSHRLLRLYGSGFTEGRAVLVWMFASVVLMSAAGAYNTVLQAQGRMWFGLGVNALWSASFLGAAALLVTPLGGTGISMAFAVGYLVTTVAVLPAIRRQGELPRDVIPLTAMVCVTAGVTATAALAPPPALAELLAVPAAILTLAISVRFLAPVGFTAWVSQAVRQWLAGRSLSLWRN